MHHRRAIEYLDEHLDLRVLELSDVKLSSFRADRPAQEQVAGRLHQPAAVDNSLAVVGIDALSSVGLQDRGACFLNLKEKRVRFAGQEEHNATPGADTSDTHNLDRDVAQFVMIEEQPAIFLHRVAVAGEGCLYALEKLLMLVSRQ